MARDVGQEGVDISFKHMVAVEDQRSEAAIDKDTASACLNSADRVPVEDA